MRAIMCAAQREQSGLVSPTFNDAGAVINDTCKAGTRRCLHRGGASLAFTSCVLVCVINTSQINLPGSCKADASHHGFSTAHKF